MQKINDIAAEFESKILPKEKWTHFAHIAVAFVILDKYQDVKSALPKLREYIIHYNDSVGTLNSNNSGYHETLTIFWMTVVNEYRAYKIGESSQFIYEQFIQSELASPNLHHIFYSTDLLFSVDARKSWVPPDKLPLIELQKMIASES